MGKRIAVKAVYTTSVPNEDIPLGSLKSSLFIGKEERELQLAARLRLLPSPRLLLESEVEVGDYFELWGRMRQDAMRDVALLEHGTTEQMLLLGLQDLTATMSPTREPLPLGNASAEVSRILFHVLNFDFQSDRKAALPSDADGLVEHVEAESSTFSLKLSSLAGTSELVKALRKTGGYGITHCGEIVPKSGNSFTAVQARETLEGLHFLLSFCRGIQTGVVLPIAYDGTGVKVYEEWGAGPCAPWRYVAAWFDPRKGEVLGKVLPGFFALWTQNTWHDAIRDALIWFCTANAPDVELDTGIILAQAALELLSWTYVVHDKHIYSEDEFGKGSKWQASKRIAKLLEELGLDTQLPAECAALKGLPGAKNWSNAPHALTAVRNDIIHPKKKLGQLSLDAAYEARNLGLRYIEFVLLKLCGYDGEYCNRLSRPRCEEVTKVPWAT